MSDVRCQGWWEQAGFGRQPMTDLVLSFDAGTIDGSGIDIIGPFTLSGTVDQGQAVLRKSYIGQHQVEYVGTFDGEGTLQGMWRIAGAFHGKWLIRITAEASGQAKLEDVEEWVPPTN